MQASSSEYTSLLLRSEQSGLVDSNGIKIWYESFGKSTDPPIILIMGLDAQCTIWSAYFIDPLVNAGYRVIRFDNRDIGLSTWIEDWNKKRPYLLEDMAKDTVGLMDALDIQKAHVIGVSMGGMIAQTLTLDYPERVKTLTSLLSTGYGFDIKVQPNLLRKLLAWVSPFLIPRIDLTRREKSEEALIDWRVRSFQRLAGKRFPFIKDRWRALFTYNIRVRKGFNPKCAYHQLTAIILSGSRLERLPEIKVPTLVAHGTDDWLVPPEHARRYAPLIPRAKLVWLAGVGHEIPEGICPELHQEIFELFSQAE